MTKRIRIFFINCPTLALDAACHLLLAQNTIQRTIQFEIDHYWIYSLYGNEFHKEKLSKILINEEENNSLLSTWAAKKARARADIKAVPEFSLQLKIDGWWSVANRAIANYDEWFERSKYNKYDHETSPAIIITETPFEGDYLSYAQSNLAVISIANWEKYIRPISAIEYISCLSALIRFIFEDELAVSQG